MKIVAFTIIKNAVKQQYPIDLVIKQHKNLFNKHIIGIPRELQDDGTRELVSKATKECGQNVGLFDLDWPGETAWSEESLDKTLQQQIIDYIEEKEHANWIIKIDADEFYHENDFDQLLDMLRFTIDAKDLSIVSTSYRQYMGTPMYHVWDPTIRVRHIFKPGKAKFSGNDAMQIDPVSNMHSLSMSDIILHHIGYLKPTELITTRIKEHFTLNKSMYKLPNLSVLEGYKFSFPTHKNNCKLWPIAIRTILDGTPNEIEYFKHSLEDVPLEIRENMNRFSFYDPFKKAD